ncbi:helix-turn-helix domain-containing protein [Methylobacterium haplocladii]|uniref:Chromosomal replication initiator DnaA C-terminal domain-containing protein n=1 Tax=Methylobacterium haplocladii TaxID=1176176 RepID=A0A512ISB8_9HYPH|nr:helix-turn-helix domain-containing protein [Methylobacterium haplocladii]GEP00581.1 hypothetical protein MHA02_29680 [Methylobacterium haplocladii]GJD85496.1 Chromosomal replication initiator protein DnaA [Methylobacterium haplocladii]GLS57729.1 hypothetical protein GCM10007887_03850 [Methylobacterium haplocladii]
MAPPILTSSSTVCRGQIQAREYGSEAEMRSSYAAIQKRMMAPSPPPCPRPAPRAPSGAPACSWDAQVVATLGADRIYREPRRIIARIAEAHGVTSADITGPSRKTLHFKARLAAIAEVLDLNPRLSIPQLGKIFGGRDSTTIRNAFRHLGHEPQPVGARQ